MSEKWSRLGRIFLFFLIFFMLVWYGSRIVEPKDNLDQYGMKDVSANGILSEGKDSIDVLFLGDSLVYSSISPMEMYEKEGLPVICAPHRHNLCTIQKACWKEHYKINRQSSLF